MYYSPIKMKELLSKHGFNLKKMFGQNFIIDENIINNKDTTIDTNTVRIILILNSSPNIIATPKNNTFWKQLLVP